MRLASNPLLTTIIALIHYKGKKLPNKRIELYDISTETFLEHWVNLRMQMRLTEDSQLKDKNEIIEIMAPIAFEIHENKSNGLIEEYFAAKGDRYFSDSDKFSLEDFNHPDVCPPTRLLAHYIKNAPYDQKLILDSVDYYRSCPQEEKNGVFAILYKVLNHLE